MTSGTSGPHGSGSSTSVDLTRYLASRLRVRLEGLGSTLFSLTWKQSATPAGRSFSLLRASAPRNKGTELTGWPTCRVGNGGHGNPIRSTDGRARLEDLVLGCWPVPAARDGEHCTGQEQRTGGRRSNLTDTVTLAGYPGPTAEDGRRGGLPARPWDKGVPLSQVVALAPRAAARASDGSKNGRTMAGVEKELLRKGNLDELPSQAMLAPWAAAAARDWRSDRSQLSSEDLYGSKGQPLARQALYADSGSDAIGSGTATASTGQLNPNLSRWIMGIPAEWASCAPTATRSSRRPPPSSSARTSMPWGAIF